MRSARRFVDAHTGEHGVYGTVLVTALIGADIDAASDLDVIVFLLGTVGVFWLAHVYAAVVASRGRTPVPPLREGLLAGVRHSGGMVVAMLVPVALLGLGAVGVLGEWPAYWAALGSGVLVLGAIGYGNARRTGGTRRWRVLGTAVTAGLGVIVILLSILVH